MTQFILKVSTLWQVSAFATTVRTIIFTVGHFFIDFYVISTITGASVGEATLASLVAPALNGVWYWILDRFWTQTHLEREDWSRMQNKG
jgi:uncharacterized membrane protein